MNKHEFANQMIIRNSGRRGWRYRLRDGAILVFTWGAWFFIALQPWLNYTDKRADGRLFHLFSAIDFARVVVALVLLIFLVLHLWAKYNKLLYRYAKRREGSALKTEQS